MRWSGKLEQAQHFGCCLLAATIPFIFIWSTLSIWVILLCWALSGRFRSTWHHFKEQPAYWLWVAYFGMHALSYFWSADKDQSIFDSVSKLSLVILPVIVGAGSNICPRRLEQIIGSFILGVTAVAFFCYAQAVFAWQQDGDSGHFFYHEIVKGLDANAVYMAWYVLAALSALLLVRWNFLFAGKARFLQYATALILLIFLVLLSSRLLLALFVGLVLPAYLFRLVRGGKRPWGAFVAMVLLIGGGAVLALTDNPVKERFKDVMHRDVRVAFLPDYHDTIPHFNNLTLRLFVWRCGIDNMQKHQLWLKGCGNGDEHHIQNARFEELGITPDRQDQYNVILHDINLHNMYLQSLIVLGIPGLLLFLGMMMAPFFFVSRMRPRGWFLCFHIIAFCFMMQESALQTQAGVIFFTFFSCIYWQAVKRASNPENLPRQKGNQKIISEIRRR